MEAQFKKGCHAIVVQDEAQADAFLLTCTGMKRPLWGRVRYNQVDVHSSPSARAQMASLYREELSEPDDALHEGVETFFKQVFVDNFFHGHYHAPSSHEVILIAALGAIVLSAFKRALNHRLLGLVVLALAISTFYGVWYWNDFAHVRAKIPIIKAFNLTRFHWLHPLIWITIFALAIRVVVASNKWGRALGLGFCLLHLAHVVRTSRRDQTRSARAQRTAAAPVRTRKWAGGRSPESRILAGT